MLSIRPFHKKTILFCIFLCKYSGSIEKFFGCGNKEITPVPDPQWKVEFKLPQGQAGNPQWADKQVDFYQFENTMSIVLRLEDEMTPFLSDNDVMAAIVNGEVREVS